MLDVNVLVYMANERVKQHERAAEWFNSVAGDRVVLLDVVATGFMRQATRLVAGERMCDVATARSLLDGWRSLPNVKIVGTGDGWWQQFDALARDLHAGGNIFSDIHCAAAALAAGYTLVSFDSDFYKFPGLTWLHLPGDQLVTNPT
jgi:toxin-antitoxin system PIN domain toxin